jgi:hypothetical protein
MSNVYDVKLKQRPPCYIDVSSNDSRFSVNHCYWHEMYVDVDGDNVGVVIDVHHDGVWSYIPRNEPTSAGVLLFIVELLNALNQQGVGK